MPPSIHIQPSHKGLLHKAMNVSPDKPLSLSAIASTKNKAKKSGNVKLEKQAVFAENARRWHSAG